jgi:hypothetical protein
VELHKGALCGAPRNIVTALTTTMADVSAGKTANTHMYAKSVAESEIYRIFHKGSCFLKIFFRINTDKNMKCRGPVGYIFKPVSGWLLFFPHWMLIYVKLTTQ